MGTRSRARKGSSTSPESASENDQTVPADDEPYKPEPSEGEDDSTEEEEEEEEEESTPTARKKRGRGKTVRTSRVSAASNKAKLGKFEYKILLLNTRLEKALGAVEHANAMLGLEKARTIIKVTEARLAVSEKHAIDMEARRKKSEKEKEKIEKEKDEIRKQCGQDVAEVKKDCKKCITDLEKKLKEAEGARDTAERKQASAERRLNETTDIKKQADHQRSLEVIQAKQNSAFNTRVQKDEYE